MHTVDLEDFRHGGTNITALRLVDPENPLVQRVIRDWVFHDVRRAREASPPPPSTSANPSSSDTPEGLSSSSLTVNIR